MSTKEQIVAKARADAIAARQTATRLRATAGPKPTGGFAQRMDLVLAAQEAEYLRKHPGHVIPPMWSPRSPW